MPPTTATYTVSQDALSAEEYRVVIEVTATTNDLDLQLFVFDTVTDAYVSVATRYTLEAAPSDKQTAIDEGKPYYRATMVQRILGSVTMAQAFVDHVMARISYLCISLDRASETFTGSMVVTVPSEAEYVPLDHGPHVHLDTVNLIAGDTLTLPMRWAVEGVNINLTGYDVTSQVRLVTDESSGPPVDTLTCTIDPDQINNTGKFVVSATDVQTALWPIGRLICDVRLDSGVAVTHTEPFIIIVHRPVTA